MKKLLAKYHNSHTLIEEEELSDISSLVSKLNEENFELGSGHDGTSLIKNEDNSYILTLIPYPGKMNQVVEFHPVEVLTDIPKEV